MKAKFLGSNLLAHVAKDAVALAATKPNQSLVAIIFSSAFIEALLNDYLQDLIESNREDLRLIKSVADSAGLHERMAIRRLSAFSKPRPRVRRRILVLTPSNGSGFWWICGTGSFICDLR
jgi:hypothetical protein